MPGAWERRSWATPFWLGEANERSEPPEYARALFFCRCLTLLEPYIYLERGWLACGRSEDRRTVKRLVVNETRRSR